VQLIGLTGGIGSGKSTVARAFADRGAFVIDADAIVRELQQPGQVVLEEMVRHFGGRILHADGTLNRQFLANLVFSDPAELAVLNSIVHPAVKAEIGRRVNAQRESNGLVVLDIPLLVEKGSYVPDVVIVVDVDPEVAIRRLVEQRGFAESDARARMAQQASREERLALADFVISNDGDRGALAAEIDRCLTWLGSRNWN
jgi:dephospho-CoA kinase